MLYVFDIGNTLKKNGSISKKNKESINQLRISNRICIATFRNKTLLKEDLSSIKYDYLITHNGGAIYFQDQLIYVKYLPEDTVDVIMHFAVKNNMAIAFYTLDSSYCIKKKHLKIVKERKFPILNKIETYTNKAIISIALFSNASFKVPLENISVDYWEDFSKCNIQAKSITKASAVNFIHEHSKESWDTTISFGDGPNDALIVKKSKIGYAMHNSHPDTLEIADTILDNTDGLAIHKEISSWLSIKNS